jgi:hypothetical protein
MLGVRRSPEYAYISSMRCPNGSFDSLMRFFGLDYAGSTLYRFWAHFGDAPYARDHMVRERKWWELKRDD